jgi:hypothetical protein
MQSHSLLSSGGSIVCLRSHAESKRLPFLAGVDETLSHERKTVRELAAGKRLCDPHRPLLAPKTAAEALRKPAQEWRDETRGPDKTLRDPHHRSSIELILRRSNAQ